MRDFCVGRENFPPYQKAWCGVCYKEAPGYKFPIRELEEKENDTDIVVDKEDDMRFKEGKNGDHLMGIPFFCNLCQFRNLQGRNPSEFIRKDGKLVAFIKRANLGAFWSREPSTVAENHNRGERYFMEGSEELGLMGVTGDFG